VPPFWHPLKILLRTFVRRRVISWPSTPPASRGRPGTDRPGDARGWVSGPVEMMRPNRQTERMGGGDAEIRLFLGRGRDRFGGAPRLSRRPKSDLRRRFPPRCSEPWSEWGGRRKCAYDLGKTCWACIRSRQMPDRERQYRQAG